MLEDAFYFIFFFSVNKFRGRSDIVGSMSFSFFVG